MSVWKRPSTRNLPIIRRNEDLENLLVFGYQCKLFQDDEKAKYIDQGRHLIPWMGDPAVMIDRYDGRGHLHDLNPHDSERVSCRGEETPEDEQRIEELCEEERYLELHTDLVQKAMYEEEELKRLNEAISDGYSAVGFNYNMGNPQEDVPEEPKEEEEDEPYYAPPELQLPADVLPPSTVKLHAIIEKTALFVSKQGAQMEIMIKTKQKDNAQFEFLEYGTALNPYYKHMVKMLKSGKYQPRNQRTRRQSSNEDYLHPSLNRTKDVQPVVKEQTREEFINSVSSKLPSGQIENTMYAALLSNLSKHTGRDSPNPVQAKGSHKPASSSSEYNKSSMEMADSSHIPPQAQAGDLVHQGHLYPGYAQESYNYQYDDINNGPLQPPVPGMEPVHLPRSAHGSNGQPQVPHSQHHIPHSQHQSYSQPHGLHGPAPVTNHSSHVPVTEALSSIGDYTDPDVVEGPHIMPPPPDMQPVIDKMATYVGKNGPEFEMIVRKKQDERFAFLNAGHAHNPYYEHKKALYQREAEEQRAAEEAAAAAEKARKEQQAREMKAEQENNESEETGKHYNKAISFSLRAKEVESLPSALRTTALLYESSEEEEENSAKEKPEGFNQGQVAPPAEWIPAMAPKETPEPSSSSKTQNSEEVEKKQAESRLKDKLAHAARDKLAQASKENQMKAERKRKAAMFINMLKTSQPSGGGAEKSDAAPPAPLSLGEEAALSAQASPHLSQPSSPAPAAVSNRPSQSQDTASVQIRSTHSPNVPEARKMSRSRSRSPKKRRSRSPIRKRSKSPAVWHRSRSRSPKRRRNREPTPPSSYNVVRRSVSPVKRWRSRSRSRTPARYRVFRRSRSREKSSKSRSKRSRSRSRNRKSPSRSRKRSRSRSKTRSKKSARSRSRTRKRSRSRSKAKKSKKKNKSPTRSPKHKKSHDSDRKSDKKSHRSKHKKRDKESKKSRYSTSDSSFEAPSKSPIIHEIDDSPPAPGPIHQDGGIISDSSSVSSTPERAGPSSPHQMYDTTKKGSSQTISSSSSSPVSSLSSDSSPSPPRRPVVARVPPIKQSLPATVPPLPLPVMPQALMQRPVPPPVSAPPPKVNKPPPAPSIDMFAD